MSTVRPGGSVLLPFGGVDTTFQIVDSALVRATDDTTESAHHDENQPRDDDEQENGALWATRKSGCLSDQHVS